MSRKLLFSFLALGMVLGLLAAGCAPEPSAPTTPTTPTSPTTPSTPTTPSQPADKVYKWTFLHEHPAGTPLFNYITRTADILKDRTNGRMELKVAAGGEIVPAYDCVEALHEGVAEVCWGNGVGNVKLIGPSGYLLTPTGLPGGPHIMELIAWYYIGGGEELANSIWGDWGVSVGGVPCAAELFCHSNVKLESLDDFKGVKFRTMGFWADILNAQGASVVTLSGSEIYEAAQRGVIDAFEYCPPSQNWPMGFQEITKYVGVPGIHSPSILSYVLVNHDAWDSLPSDLQKEFRDAWKLAVVDVFLNDWYVDGEAMQKYEDYGSEIVTLSDEAQIEIAKAGLAICEKYAAEDATFKMVFDHQKAFFQTMRKATQGVTPQYCLFDYAT